MSRYFTADTHFWHKNIQKYCPNRASIWGNNIEKMNAGLTKRWNDKITNNDDVYVIGDFAFCNRTKLAEVLAGLNGRKHLILGNHDEYKWADYIRAGFDSVQRYLFLNLKEAGPVGLAHDPSNCIVDSSVIWLCGHLHQQFLFMNNCINVGCDVHNYAPVSEDELQPLIEAIKHNFNRKDPYTMKEFIAEFKKENNHG